MTAVGSSFRKPSAIGLLSAGLVLIANASGCGSSDTTGTGSAAGASTGGVAGSGSGGAGGSAGASGTAGGLAGQAGAGGQGGMATGGAGGTTGGSGCPITGPVCIGNATDDFSNDMLAPYWVKKSGCATTAVSGGALVLTRPASCSDGAGVLLDACKYRICGDFDAQVDFSFTDFTVPATGRRYAGMDVQALAGPLEWNMTIERFNASYTSASFTQQENYKAYMTDPEDSLATFVASADAAGRLRITRVGTTLTSFYWKNGAWAPIVTAVAPSDPMLLIQIYAGGDDPTAFTVLYDNFSIVSSP